MSHSGADELLDVLATLNLVPSDQLASVRAQCAAAGTVTAVDAATRLVERKLVTQFQADRLLAGNGHECVLAARYQIQEQLGAGAMGTVYRALDTNLDRVVA